MISACIDTLLCCFPPLKLYLQSKVYVRGILDILYGIFDLELSRNQRLGFELSSSIGFNKGIRICRI